MRLSTLVVAGLLFATPTLLAQHSSAGSASSGGSASHSSGSSGSSSGSASHSSSGGGASHSSSASSSASSASHSASSHASPGSGGAAHARSANSSSHTSAAGAAGPRSSASPSVHGTELARADTVRPIREPVTAGVEVKENGSSTSKPTQPEKRGFFSFLRHPFRRPEPKPRPEIKPAEPDLHLACKHEPCAVCPPGRSMGKTGGCGAATPPVTIARGECRAGLVWNGVACGNTIDCARFTGQAAALANELRGIKAEMETACSNNSSAQECSEVTLRYYGAVSRYRELQNEAPVSCRSMLPDPLSL
jgi:hypothetical protein